MLVSIDHKMLKDLLCPSQLSFEGGLSNVLLFTNIGLVGMKVSMLSFLFADRERSILRPGTMKKMGNLCFRKELSNIRNKCIYCE